MIGNSVVFPLTFSINWIPRREQKVEKVFLHLQYCLLLHPVSQLVVTMVIWGKWEGIFD